MSLLGRCQTTVIKSCNRDLARDKGLLFPPIPLPCCHHLTRPPAHAAPPASHSPPAGSAGAGSWRWRHAGLSRPPPPPAPQHPRGCRDKGTERDDIRIGLLGQERLSCAPPVGRQPVHAGITLASVPLGQCPCLQRPVAPVRGLLRDFLGNILEMQTAAMRSQRGPRTPGPHQPSTNKNLPKDWRTFANRSERGKWLLLTQLQGGLHPHGPQAFPLTRSAGHIPPHQSCTSHCPPGWPPASPGAWGQQEPSP